MKTWDSYKKQIKALKDQTSDDIIDMENTSEIISSIYNKRTSLGISQRELAKLFEVPNKETLSAINEVKQMEKIKNYGKTYSDIDTMLKELLS